MLKSAFLTFFFLNSPCQMWGQMIIITTFMPVGRNGEKGMYQGFVGEEVTIMWKEFLDNIWSFILLLVASNYVFLFLFFLGGGGVSREKDHFDFLEFVSDFFRAA